MVTPGTRIRITVGPRTDATGIVVSRHLVDLPAPGTVTVLLDRDPLGIPPADQQHARGWTCQIRPADLEVLT